MPIPVTANSEQWLAQVQEEIIDPHREIVDSHHHLWRKRFAKDYLLTDLQRDTDLGHKVKKKLFLSNAMRFMTKTRQIICSHLGKLVQLSRLRMKARTVEVLKLQVLLLMQT
jgi:hypothetical protein